MSSVFERLSRALAPAIALEGELASGGMGHVFAGRDTVLGRRIAVKTLREEMATAVAAERFLLEARAAAQLQHPNVVRVYTADIAAGILYFTMELVEGQTLDAALKERKRTVAETAAIGRELLAALGEAHRIGIVHRDVKPSNIFLVGRHTKLGDFGIARVLESSAPTLTAPGRQPGTPRYMSPEQARGDQVTHSSDLYSTGLVLFEACTGRVWMSGLAPQEGDWSDVPSALRSPLRRALQLDPARRWPSAAEFAAALPHHVAGGQGRRLRPMIVAVAILVLLGAAAAGRRIWSWSAHPPPGCDLALFPFEVAGLPDSALERSIGRAAEWYFRRLPNLRLEPRAAAKQRWEDSPLPHDQRLAAVTPPCRYGARVTLFTGGGRVEARVNVVNQRGEPVLATAVAGDSTDPLTLGDSIGGRMLGAISSGLPSTYRRGAALVQVRAEAAAEFLEGEAAAERDAWLPAEAHYANALRYDSTFVLAAWRLGNARRWMPLRSTPPFPPGFYALFQAHAADLPEVDRRLVEAQFVPSGAPRFERYEAARTLAPEDAYVMLLYGDELFHRGPLGGRPLEDAVDMLRHAVAVDPTLAPAWEHLAWALIRLGHQAEAARALKRLTRIAGRPEESEIYLPGFLQVAYDARFEPATLPAGGPALLRAPAALALAARGALAFDLPEAELQFGGQLAELERAPASLHASGHLARGVALVALGRPSAALAAFDSAATLFADPAEARLQAAEWRVIPTALGVPGFPETEVAAGRRALAEIAAHPGGVRAAWALALDGLARRDTAAGARWRRVVASRDTTGSPRTLLLEAMAAAADGDPASAVRRSEPALASDSAGYAPDPFFRAALHLLRGEWLAALGRPDDADRAWLWYENTDVIGWPQAEVQPAEVDWALGTWARVRRAGLARGEAGQARGCALGRRALEIWGLGPVDAPVARVADSVRTALSRCPP